MSEAPQTLGEYRRLTAALFSEASPAVRFLDDKIKQASNGEAELVIAEGPTMLYLLTNIHYGGQQE